MNIVLRNVSFVCVRGASDTLLINQEGVLLGVWPFEGYHTFKVELAKESTEKWLIKNFGVESLNHLKIIDEKE